MKPCGFHDSHFRLRYFVGIYFGFEWYFRKCFRTMKLMMATETMIAIDTIACRYLLAIALFNVLSFVLPESLIWMSCWNHLSGSKTCHLYRPSVEAWRRPMRCSSLPAHRSVLACMYALQFVGCPCDFTVSQQAEAVEGRISADAADSSRWR